MGSIGGYVGNLVRISGLQRSVQTIESADERFQSCDGLLCWKVSGCESAVKTRKQDSRGVKTNTRRQVSKSRQLCGNW